MYHIVSMAILDGS